jgi:hypothetical protein
MRGLSNNEAGRVDGCVGETERGDDAVATALSRAEMDEQNLIFAVMDDAGEVGAAADQVAGGEMALEDGVLQVVAEAAHGFEDLAEASVVADVVTDEIRLAHEAASLMAFYRDCLVPVDWPIDHGTRNADSYAVSRRLRKRITAQCGGVQISLRFI